MASVKFLRRQAEKCAELAKRTHDEDSRQRCEQLQRTYTHLAEVEEGQAAGPERRPAACLCAARVPLGVRIVTTRTEPPLSCAGDTLKRARATETPNHGQVEGKTRR